MKATAASVRLKNPSQGVAELAVGGLDQRLDRYGLLPYVACSFGPLTCRAASVVLAGDNTCTGARQSAPESSCRA
jgi:hypothetical protein